MKTNFGKPRKWKPSANSPAAWPTISTTCSKSSTATPNSPSPLSPAGSEIRGDLDEIAKAGDRAARLVAQLLAFSRRQVMKPDQLNLNAVVSDLLKMLGRVIGEDIRLEFVPGQRLGSVFADRGMLEQVLINLCVNARDAMPGGGVLTIETENMSFNARDCLLYDLANPGRYVMLAVADTGHGIAEDDLAHVFEPFFTTKEVGKGTGLGLATVYGIVKQHEGAVRVQSEPGAGTTFDIYLPMSDRPAHENEDDRNTPVAGGTETILLAEDDAMVRRLAGRMLEHAGYTVLYAHDGEEAVALFRQHSDDIDLLIFDAVMPNLGGWDAYERIQAIRPDVPAFFASGYSEGRHRPPSSGEGPPSAGPKNPSPTTISFGPSAAPWTTTPERNSARQLALPREPGIIREVVGGSLQGVFGVNIMNRRQISVSVALLVSGVLLACAGCGKSEKNMTAKEKAIRAARKRADGGGDSGEDTAGKVFINPGERVYHMPGSPHIKPGAQQYLKSQVESMGYEPFADEKAGDQKPAAKKPAPKKPGGARARGATWRRKRRRRYQQIRAEGRGLGRIPTVDKPIRISARRQQRRSLAPDAQF